MKLSRWLVLALVASAFALPAQAQHLDGIAAVVNDDVVLQSDVEEQLGLLMSRAQSMPDSLMMDTLRTQILNQLIDEKLIFAEGKRQGISATDVEVEKELDSAMKDIKDRFGGEQGFRDQLQKENTTEEKLREKYRSEIQRQIIGRKLMQKMLPRRPVTQVEAEAYFKANKSKFPKVPAELRLSVIQIPPAADSAVDAKGHATATAIRKRLAAGEKFAKVASEVSQDQATSKSGGDLGFVSRGSLDRPLENAIFALKNNEISQPVRSSAGWHLVQALERDTLRTRAGKDSLDDKGVPAVEVHARHILVRVEVSDADIERARALSDNVRSSAIKGADFSALAKKYSKFDGPNDNGDIGFVSEGALQPQIRAGLDSLKVGGISEVLTNAAGFNIFKVTDKKPEREYELSEIKQELPDAVADLKQRERYDDWMKTLRTKAHIEIRNS